MRIHLQHANSFASIGVIAVIIAFTIQVNTKPFPVESKTTLKNCQDTARGNFGTEQELTLKTSVNSERKN